MMTSIFLVDDHAVVRAGIRMLLESKTQIHIVGEADSAELALERIPPLSPDIALLDLSLPGMNGIELARNLKQMMPKLRMIALSMHEDTEYVQGFLEAGGSGYVPKSALETQLLDAISAVSRGEYYAPTKLLAELAREMASPDPYKNAHLTDREKDVVRFIAQGCTYKEIAGLLGISEKTVATYRERAAEKLGVKTRAELVRWALEHDLMA
ncbi:MAG: response regulator transcription factor [Trueperaceae bacterium]|nr:response regulator transcription factor [Trueperaceae bacterium]